LLESEQYNNQTECKDMTTELLSTSLATKQQLVKGLNPCTSFDRLYAFAQTTEEFVQSELFLNHLVNTQHRPTLNVIVAVHSHADLLHFYQHIPKPRLCLAIPCCFQPNIVHVKPIAKFRDEALHSEKNTIYMWYEE